MKKAGKQLVQEKPIREIENHFLQVLDIMDLRYSSEWSLKRLNKLWERALDMITQDEVEELLFRSKLGQSNLLAEDISAVFVEKLKSQLSRKIFNISYFEMVDKSKAQWQNLMKTNNIREIEPFLKSYIEYIRSFYQLKYHTGDLSYCNLLKKEWGNDLVETFYGEIKMKAYLIERMWKKMSSRQNSSILKLKWLSFNEQEMLDFLNYFLAYVKPIYEPMDIQVSYEYFEISHPEEGISNIRLKPYRSFYFTLDEFLEKFGRIYADIYTKGTQKLGFSMTKQKFVREVVVEWIRQLPIVTKDFSEFLMNYFKEKGKSVYMEDVYQELLSSYLNVHKNPLQMGNINVVENSLVHCIGFNAEEKCFNEPLSLIDLNAFWGESARCYFNTNPSHCMETLLHLEKLTDERVGDDFIKLSSLLLLFNDGMIQEQYNHPLKELLDFHREGKLAEWKPSYSIYSKITNDHQHMKFYTLQYTNLLHYI